MAISDIKISAKLLDPSEGEITEIILPQITNNISGDVSLLSTPSEGKDIKFFEDVWKDSIVLVPKNSAPFIVFDQTSDSDCKTNVEITIKGNDLAHFALHFDNISKDWATEVEVNGETFVNDSYIFIASGLSNLTEITVVIKKWNKPNRPIRLLGICVGLNLDFRSISGYEFTISGGTITNKISYGIAVNDGEVVLEDKNNILIGLYRNGIFTNELPIKLYFNGSQQGVFFTNNVDYSLEDKQLTFDLTSRLVNYLEENVIGYDLPLSAGGATTKNAREFLEEIMGSDTVVLDEITKQELEKRTYVYVTAETTTKYDMLNLLLKSCLSIMYENKNGEIEVKYVG